MKTRVIILEVRKPTKAEKGLYGSTNTEDSVSRIFINSQQSSKEFIDTFFHEVAHAFVHWHCGDALSSAEEEKVARTVGNVVEPLFRRYPK